MQSTNENITWNYVSENYNGIGNNFMHLFYDSIENNRHQIGNLYAETAWLFYDYHHIEGRNDIQDFFNALQTLEHSITTMQAHPQLEQVNALSQQLTVIILIDGILKRNFAPYSQRYSQTMIINPLNATWYITTDIFLLEEIPEHEY